MEPPLPPPPPADEPALGPPPNPPAHGEQQVEDMDLQAGFGPPPPAPDEHLRAYQGSTDNIAPPPPPPAPPGVGEHAEQPDPGAEPQQDGGISSEDFSMMSAEQQAAYMQQWEQQQRQWEEWHQWQQYYGQQAGYRQDQQARYGHEQQGYGQEQSAGLDWQQQQAFAQQASSQEAWSQQPPGQYPPGQDGVQWGHHQHQYGAPGGHQQPQYQAHPSGPHQQPFPPAQPPAYAPPSSGDKQPFTLSPHSVRPTGDIFRLDAGRVPAFPAPSAPAARKTAVPDWVRQELLKRRVQSERAAAAAKKGDSDSDEDDAGDRSARRLTETGSGSRWGDLHEVPKKKGARQRSGGPSKEAAASEEPDAQKQPRMAALMKKNLTGILIDVTDSLFSKLADQVVSSSKAVEVAAITGGIGSAAAKAEAGNGTDTLESDEGDSSDSGSGGDLLGLGYADESDDEVGSEEAHKRQEAKQAQRQLKAQRRAMRQQAQQAAAEAQTAQAAKAAATAAAAASGPATGKGPSRQSHPESQISDHYTQEHDGYDVGQPLDPDSTGSLRMADTAQMGLQPPAFNKGDRVWYLERNGSRTAARVLAVDVSVDPPSYAVHLEHSGNTRETEHSRLTLYKEAPGKESQQWAQQQVEAEELQPAGVPPPADHSLATSLAPFKAAGASGNEGEDDLQSGQKEPQGEDGDRGVLQSQESPRPADQPGTQGDGAPNEGGHRQRPDNDSRARNRKRGRDRSRSRSRQRARSPRRSKRNRSRPARSSTPEQLGSMPRSRSPTACRHHRSPSTKRQHSSGDAQGPRRRDKGRNASPSPLRGSTYEDRQRARSGRHKSRSPEAATRSRSSRDSRGDKHSLSPVRRRTRRDNRSRQSPSRSRRILSRDRRRRHASPDTRSRRWRNSSSPRRPGRRR